MVGYIYLITDTTNGMKYTGKHHYHIEGQLDPNYHGSGTIIKNIYKKRPETLKEEYIKTCYSEEEMNSDEQYYIKLFKTLYPNGYNLTEGGDGGILCEETRRKLSKTHKGLLSGEKHPMFGKHLSEETKKKIGKSQKGKHPTEETRRKMSESRRGEKNYMFGKHHSDETKIKIGEKSKGRKSWNKDMKMSEEFKRKNSEAHKGLQTGEKNPMFGKHHSEESKKKISEARKGKPGPNKGKPMSEETKKKLSDARKGKKCPEITIKKLSKKVLQFTLDGEFVREWESTHECERNGFNRGAVYLCCNGKKPYYKGFKWCYK